MTRGKRFSWCLAILCLGWGVFAWAAKEEPYRPPEPGAVWMRRDQLSLDEEQRSSLARALVGLASLGLEEKVAARERSRAIGLAFQLNPDFEPAIIASFKLRHGQPVAPVEGLAKSGEVVEVLLPLARDLLAGGEADQELGWAILHVLVQLPRHADGAILLFEKQKNRADPDWERLYGGTEPGGAAREFARAASEAGVLLMGKEGPDRVARLVRVSAQAQATTSRGAAKVKLAGGAGAGRKGVDLAGRYAVEMWKNRWPVGWEVRVGWEQPSGWVSGDEVSCGAGCALALTGLVTGEVYDPRFAVLGGLGEDGALGAVAGLEEKLRAALQAGLSHVVVSPGMREELLDLLVDGGYQGVTRLQIFSASRMAEVNSLALAPPARDAGLSEAMALFAEIARDAGAAPSVQWLGSAAVRERLMRVVELAPNHVSARLLGMAGAGQIPRQYSLAGSVKRVWPWMERVRRTGAGAEAEGDMREIMYGIRGQRARLHVSVRPLADAVAGVAESRSRLAEQEKGKGLGATDWSEEHAKRTAALAEQWKEWQSEPEVAAILARWKEEGW